MATTKISEHISYKEATHSDTAVRRGIKNEPSSIELKAMKILAKKVFEPLRLHFNEPIKINSFYRSIALNKQIGGSKTSQHCKGEAIDLDAMNGITNKQLYDYIKNNLEFDQLIWEFGTAKNPDWVHVSFTETKVNRKQLLKAERKNGKSIYTVLNTISTSNNLLNKTGVVSVSTTLNVREKGVKDAKIIGKLKNKDKVVIIGKRLDWLKIEKGNLKGWVAAKYVKRV
jgi:zinc D-Ala-D-Ala carboxypeptidase